MEMEYRYSNGECSRPAELVRKSVGRTVNGNLIVKREPDRACKSYGSEVNLLPA